MKIFILTLLIFVSSQVFSQSFLMKNQSLSISQTHRKSFTDFHNGNLKLTYKDSTVIVFDSLNSDERNEYDAAHRRKLWQFKDMSREYLTGAGIGLVGGFLGGLVGSWTHVVGDTTKSGSDFTTTAVMVAMEIGHFIGTTAGVNMGGHKGKVKGSIFFSAIGTALGDAAGIYLMTRDKSSTRFAGLGIIAVVSPLISTIFYNFTHNF